MAVRMDISAGQGRRGSKRSKKNPSSYGKKKKRARYADFQTKTEELKFHDLDINDTVIAAGGNIAASSVLLIAAGDTESTRDGRKMTVKKIGWKFLINMEAATGTISSETVRVILYLDSQANGATAAVTDLLASDDFQSFNNLSNSRRFRTLMDRTYSLNIPSCQGTTTSGMEFAINDSFYHTCNIPIEYSATAGALTELRSNNIGVLLLAEVGIARFESKMRVRFVG